MNHDDHKPDMTTLIAPELEARVVAWVSGEASAFETAELERLSIEKPELVIFKRRIAAVRGLVTEAIRPDTEPLLLSAERRAKLLQAIGANENKTTPEKSVATVVPSPAATKKISRKDRRWLLALAASLTVGLFISVTFRSIERTYGEVEMKAREMTEYAKKDAVVQVALPASAPEQDITAATTGTVLVARKTAKQKGNSVQRTADGKSKSDAFGQSATGSIRLAALQPTEEYLPSFDSGHSYYYSKSAAPSANRARAELRDATVAGATRQSLSDVTEGKSEDSLKYALGKELGGARGDFASLDRNTPQISQNYIGMAGVGAPASPATKSIASDDEKSVLSPFTIAAGKDEGHNGDSSLAGDRLTPPNKIAEEKKSDADAAESDRPVVRPAKPPAADASFLEINANKEPVSTFSLHVSDVSFRLVQAALANNEAIDPARIRPEEFYNAFSYGDPTPALAEKVSCRIEQAAHPFLQQRNLVRIAVKVAAAGRDAARPLRLTVLLDTSGSMEREDRAATVHRAMQALISLLGPNDRLTLISFARQPRLLAESVAGDQAGRVLDIIAHTPPEGGTNLEAALRLGDELAHRQFDSSAQNRIVLLTDGAANLGNADPAQLAAAIEALRQQGIAFDACGVGLEGLDDDMLERLTRKGDGRYYVLNSPEAADAGFAKQLAGAFRPAAENVKLQVRFNPARVGHYRLIGFEQHRLREEDFRNDRVDAAELAAEEAAVAVYQVEALPQGEGELGEVFVRFRDAASGNMVEHSWTLNYDAHSPAFDRATPTMQLAGIAALLAEQLRGGQNADAIKLGDLAPVMNQLRSRYASEPRVQELVTMFGQARKLAGE